VETTLSLEYAFIPKRVQACFESMKSGRRLISQLQQTFYLTTYDSQILERTPRRLLGEAVLCLTQAWIYFKWVESA
jgi:hypothetical protein